MKILVVGDIHWSTYSSILRSRGNYFSTRLEYLIKSLNWVEQISKQYGCEEEIFLGDTFDKPDLTAEEISALSEISWESKPRLRHFLVGNHESGMSSLKYNSTQILHKLGVIEDTAHYYPVDNKTEFLFLPYQTKDASNVIVPFVDQCMERNPNKKLIVFSHNDIKGFQMGKFISTNGYDIKEIEEGCDLYINGHLHNGGWVSPRKILNLGNLTGQNFSEDASKYEHHIVILDTDTLELEFIKNPYALNFYKIEIDNKDAINQLYFLKENSVLSIKCLDELVDQVRKELKNLTNIVEYRIVQYSKIVLNDGVQTVSMNNVDHLEQFRKFVLDNLGITEIVEQELNEVCK
jgi:hypothetical protein